MMADLLASLWSVAIIMMIGWGVLRLCAGSLALSRLETAAIAFPLGAGLISLEMLLSYFVKAPLTPRLVLAPWLVLMAVIWLIERQRRVDGNAAPGTTVSEGKTGILWYVLVFGVTFEVLYAFFRALIQPIESYDAIAIYAIKSKMFYAAGAVNGSLFTTMKSFFPHPDYPLNIPLVETFFYTMMGGLNDQLVKIIFPLFFVALLALLYSAVRRFASRTYALLAVFLLATIPQANAYAANAYHEIPLACYYFASALLLFRFIERPEDGRPLILSAIMVALGGWTKNEGLLYCVVNLAVLGAFVACNLKRIAPAARLNVAAYPVIIVLISLPWLYIKKTYGLVNHEIDLANVNPVYVVAQLHKMVPIVYEFQKQFFGPKKWLLIWPVAAAVIIIYFRKAFAGVGKYMALSLALAISGYILFYLISYVDVVFFVGKSWSRFLLHFLPLVIYWIAFTLKDEINI